MPDPAFVVSCEHGGNDVPARYRVAFAGHADVLATHRGFDAGALELARTLARRLDAPLFATRVSRLLVDVNRSLHHPRLHADVVRALPDEGRRCIVERWWRPLREGVEGAVRGALRPVVHLSAHSFTPVLDGHVREIDVAFLYDPARPREKALVAAWCRRLRRLRPDLRVRRNVPYRGTSDGHTTALRRLFPDARYAGVEIEVNQALTTGDAAAWRRLRGELADVIAAR